VTESNARTGRVTENMITLLGAARVLYDGDKESLALIAALETRMREPLRLAIAGMVKAGKSTLLNAMLGERIAATDAGECTRIVTWYRYSASPEITMHLREGSRRRMQIRRDRGLLVFDLGGYAAEDVDWIDVGWPLAGLRKQILIDTPGIASLSEDTSARTSRFLIPEDSPSSADAVIYLMRHLHGADVRFLEAFRDTAAGAAQSVCAVGVLSRADEVGSGRIDSLLSAKRVAQRYEHDGDLASLTLGVIPVTGLLAEGARTLRESEFIAFRQLAQLTREDRERLLVSADRFVRAGGNSGLSVNVREELLARFGIFGVRMAAAMVRGGAASSSALAEAMVQQSGLEELQEFVQTQFHPRSETLKARGIVLQLEELLKARPRNADTAVREGIEQFLASAHTLRELSILADARAHALPVSGENAQAAMRILGAAGVSAPRRLGLALDASAESLSASVQDQMVYWRRMAEMPTTRPTVAKLSGVLLRSLSGVASELNIGRPLRPPTDVVPSGRPGDSGGQNADEQSKKHERSLRGEKWLKRRPFSSKRDPLG